MNYFLLLKSITKRLMNKMKEMTIKSCVLSSDTKLLNKLNNLFEQGWEIKSHSCGTFIQTIILQRR